LSLLKYILDNYHSTSKNSNSSKFYSHLQNLKKLSTTPTYSELSREIALEVDSTFFVTLSLP
jgi:hypothetical protein